ncbi:MAG: DivIVA domain-containing protein [Candidatus Calescibacterium sp.]|nr:DivIVA domain-containing protein [Candidatus Calescibacterium sp.]MDW8132370.1 DivIVA domain-containing protein [Candidatus Calescibacterium sp.]
MNNNFLTPSDISRVKFSFSFRGYNTQEVDEFLEQIEREYTRLWKENSELRSQVDFLRKELEAYKKMENIINESVITSKKLAEDIKHQAQSEANYIISKALKEAEDIRINCQKNVANLIQEINRLREIRNDMILETKNYLNLLINKIENIEKTLDNYDNLPMLLGLPMLRNKNEDQKGGITC